MNCKDIESRMIPYLDGKLAAPERAAVERHLQSCSSCEERANGFADVFGALEEWPGMEPSPYFDARLEQRLAREGAARGWLEALWDRLAGLPQAGPAFATALLGVVALAAVLVGYSPDRPEMLLSQHQPLAGTAAAADEELALYRNMAVLEDYEVLWNFEVLQELNGATPGP